MGLVGQKKKGPLVGAFPLSQDSKAMPWSPAWEGVWEHEAGFLRLMSRVTAFFNHEEAIPSAPVVA